MIIFKYIFIPNVLKSLFIFRVGVKIGLRLGVHGHIFIFLHFKEILINFDNFIYRIRFSFPSFKSKFKEFKYFNGLKTYFVSKNLFGF